VAYTTHSFLFYCFLYNGIEVPVSLNVFDLLEASLDERSARFKAEDKQANVDPQPRGAQNRAATLQVFQEMWNRFH
jgi:hypothetical protein